MKRSKAFKRKLTKGDLAESKFNMDRAIKAALQGPEALKKWADQMFPEAKEETNLAASEKE